MIIVAKFCSPSGVLGGCEVRLRTNIGGKRFCTKFIIERGGSIGVMMFRYFSWQASGYDRCILFQAIDESIQRELEQSKTTTAKVQLCLRNYMAAHEVHNSTPQPKLSSSAMA